MHFRVKVCVSMLAIALLFGVAAVSARAQDKQHVVSLSDLTKDAARPAQTRQSNEEAVRSLLSSDQAQKALKSANIDYQKVDKAVGQLSDEDLAKRAERSLAARRHGGNPEAPLFAQSPRNPSFRYGKLSQGIRLSRVSP